MESTIPKTFNEMCEWHQLTHEEKETVEQILKLLNGRKNYEAKQILQFCEMVMNNLNIVSVDFTELGI